jgi:hypothetical protein
MIASGSLLYIFSLRASFYFAVLVSFLFFSFFSVQRSAQKPPTERRNQQENLQKKKKPARESATQASFVFSIEFGLGFLRSRWHETKKKGGKSNTRGWVNYFFSLPLPLSLSVVFFSSLAKCLLKPKRKNSFQSKTPFSRGLVVSKPFFLSLRAFFKRGGALVQHLLAFFGSWKQGSRREKKTEKKEKKKKRALVTCEKKNCTEEFPS